MWYKLAHKKPSHLLSSIKCHTLPTPNSQQRHLLGPFFSDLSVYYYFFRFSGSTWATPFIWSTSNHPNWLQYSCFSSCPSRCPSPGPATSRCLSGQHYVRNTSHHHLLLSSWWWYSCGYTLNYGFFPGHAISKFTTNSPNHATFSVNSVKP